MAAKAVYENYFAALNELAKKWAERKIVVAKAKGIDTSSWGATSQINPQKVNGESCFGFYLDKHQSVYAAFSFAAKNLQDFFVGIWMRDYKEPPIKVVRFQGTSDYWQHCGEHGEDDFSYYHYVDDKLRNSFSENLHLLCSETNDPKKSS